MIATTYDPVADAFYLRLLPKGTEIVDTREVAPGINHDLDLAGNVVGIEVLNVAARSAMLFHPTSARDLQTASAELVSSPTEHGH